LVNPNKIIILYEYMKRKTETNRVITDPLMEPYFLSIDDACITVNERITPDIKYIRTKTGEDYIKPLGHFSNMRNALNKVIKSKVNSKSYDSLKEYMNEYSTMIKTFNEKFNLN
jgi:hypothetical protein